MLYILSSKYFLTEYVFSKITSDKVYCILSNEFSGGKNRFFLLLLKIEALLPFDFFAKKCFSNDLNKILQVIKEDDKLLLWDILALPYSVAIEKIVKTKTKYIWISNAFAENFPKWRIELLKRYYTLFTFDKEDSIRYKINLKEQVYSLDKEKKTLPLKYDFYFIGVNKNRRRILEYLSEKLNNYVCNFIVYENSSIKCDYMENLENVILSRCLVDIVKEGQSGFTIRVLEAALYRKKLITNNRTILDTDLYHKNNVFILDYDNFDDIDDFMKREIVPVSEAVLQKYDINYWIKEFLD